MTSQQRATTSPTKQTIIPFLSFMQKQMTSEVLDLLNKYWGMFQQYNVNKLVISRILPRTGAKCSFYSKAFSTNNRLKFLCLYENVDYINIWDGFYIKSFLFQNDGLQLNSYGAACLGRLLSDQVSLYRKKNNTEQTRETAST